MPGSVSSAYPAFSSASPSLAAPANAYSALSRKIETTIDSFDEPRTPLTNQYEKIDGLIKEIESLPNAKEQSSLIDQLADRLAVSAQWPGTSLVTEDLLRNLLREKKVDVLPRISKLADEAGEMGVAEFGRRVTALLRMAMCGAHCDVSTPGYVELGELLEKVGNEHQDTDVRNFSTYVCNTLFKWTGHTKPEHRTEPTYLANYSQEDLDADRARRLGFSHMAVCGAFGRSTFNLLREWISIDDFHLVMLARSKVDSDALVLRLVSAEECDEASVNKICGTLLGRTEGVADANDPNWLTREMRRYAMGTLEALALGISGRNRDSEVRTWIKNFVDNVKAEQTRTELLASIRERSTESRAGMLQTMKAVDLKKVEAAVAGIDSDALVLGQLSFNDCDRASVIKLCKTLMSRVDFAVDSKFSDFTRREMHAYAMHKLEELGAAGFMDPKYLVRDWIAAFVKEKKDEGVQPALLNSVQFA